ncbi:MAG: carboxypeptidase-like regulatory domain-containing protein [Pyrinomonadaceae bacterium]
MFRFLGLILIFASCCLSIAAQDSFQSCPKQIEFAPVGGMHVSPKVSLRVVEGQAIDSSGAVVPYVCVALFTRKGKRFVSQTVTDENGRFRFGKIPKGKYFLIARVKEDVFCPLNVEISRVGFPFGGFFKRNRLVLHLEAWGIVDVCSYADKK